MARAAEGPSVPCQGSDSQAVVPVTSFTMTCLGRIQQVFGKHLRAHRRVSLAAVAEHFRLTKSPSHCLAGLSWSSCFCCFALPGCGCQTHGLPVLTCVKSYCASARAKLPSAFKIILSRRCQRCTVKLLEPWSASEVLRQSSDLLQEFADWVWPPEAIREKAAIAAFEPFRRKTARLRRPVAGRSGLGGSCGGVPFDCRRTFVKTMNENLTRPEGCRRCDCPGWEMGQVRFPGGHAACERQPRKCARESAS